VDTSYPVAPNPSTNATVRIGSVAPNTFDPTMTVDQSVVPPLSCGFRNVLASMQFTCLDRHSVAVYSQSAFLVSNGVVYVDAGRLRYLGP